MSHVQEILDENLFGNEAGEDEDIERLSEYFLEKPEFMDFFSKEKRLKFVRARKGMGKSALLKYAYYTLEKLDNTQFFLSINASELRDINNNKIFNSHDAVSYWKQCICSRINMEIAKKIRFAVSDDAMTLLESAEIAGFREKNIVSSLANRLSVKFHKDIPDISLNKNEVKNNNELLKRYSDENDLEVWVFIDDIDATFKNNEESKMELSAFFSACRELVNSVKGLNIRASVRMDVWSILSNYDEALDKCEQYMLDINWSTKETGMILSKKILSYLQANYPTEPLYTGMDCIKDLDEIIGIYFTKTMKWGDSRAWAYRPLHIYCAGRPRWAAQLCKMAAKEAVNRNISKINIEIIESIMFKYGKLRLSDLQKEHNHQCKNLKFILEAFRGKYYKYTTKELLDFIKRDILNKKIRAYLDDNLNCAKDIEIARFLYRIGFITLYDKDFESALCYTRFEDAPDLWIESNINMDDIWIVHPIYRRVLNLKKSSLEITKAV